GSPFAMWNFSRRIDLGISNKTYQFIEVGLKSRNGIVPILTRHFFRVFRPIAFRKFRRHPFRVERVAYYVLLSQSHMFENFPYGVLHSFRSSISVLRAESIQSAFQIHMGLSAFQ